MSREDDLIGLLGIAKRVPREVVYGMVALKQELRSHEIEAISSWSNLSWEALQAGELADLAFKYGDLSEVDTEILEAMFLDCQSFFKYMLPEVMEVNSSRFLTVAVKMCMRSILLADRLLARKEMEEPHG